jgi:transposase
VVDSNGLPVRLALSPGEAHDVRLAGKLLSRLKSGSMLPADRGYDADWIRELAMKKGAWANIPPKSNRSDPICFSPYLYRARNRVERSSTGSNNVVGWRSAMTGLLPTTLPSFNSRQSGYGCAVMSPHPRRCFSPICLLQCGQRRGGGRTMSSTMAWRTAGILG